MAGFPVYDANAVRDLLDCDGCIAAVGTAMRRFSEGGADQPLRTIVPMGPAQLFALMPGTLVAPDGFGAKVITAFDDPARPGRSRHRGVVVLFDRLDGEVLCIADAGEVTHRRTAAASAVATDALARQDARRMTVYGAGAQAATHIRAIARVRTLDEVVVWSRDPAGADAFAQATAIATGLNVRAEPDGERAAADADIICTTTGSPTPVLLGAWVRPGTHVNLVGSSHAGPVEVDTALVAASRYIADSRRSVLAAGAEFLVALAAGAIGDDHIAGEIGEVLANRVAGRRFADEITVYKSLGHIVQDLAATAYVHARAQERA